MRPDQRGTLCVIPSLRLAVGDEGRLTLTRKFIDGMDQYARAWPGPLAVLAERAGQADDNLDRVDVRPADLSFAVHLLDFEDEAAMKTALAGAAVAMASLDYRLWRLPEVCRSLGVPLVYAIEHTQGTRLQMLAAATKNPLLRLRRAWWIKGTEKRYRKAAALAAALQCNGTPAYDAYAAINPNCHLYFDTRVRASMLASDDVLKTRTAELLAGGTLRLAFSGRLVAIKGADHLASVADELRRLGSPFTLDIFGDGELRPKIESQIRQRQLDRVMKLHGVLDFETELLPRVTRNADLFVCCHPQGDPSCTYLETMSCGVPIAGYDNDAWAGLQRVAKVGWTSPVNNPTALANLISRLNADRPALARAALATRDFAARHLFEKTFSDRIDHLLSVCGQNQTRSISRTS